MTDEDTAPRTTRRRPPVPGSIEEVQASTRGPHIGAYFDFDGTLIAGYSASAMTQDRLRNRDISLNDVGRSLRTAVQMGMGQADFSAMFEMIAEAWKGRTDEDMLEYGERLYVQRIADKVYPEARELVAAHQRQGHTVALTTSATRYQVAALAKELGVDQVLCTELEDDDGVLTGKLDGSVLWGPGKSEAVQKFAADRGIDLAESYFYADGDEDVALMHLVGKPRPTNPGRKLERAARQRGWPVQRFTSRGRTTPGMRLRSAAAMLSLVPVGALGAAVGVVKRDKRAALNTMSALWLDNMFRLNGVSFDIVGEEHLWSHRPAVFIFNHRNNLDPMMAAKLVARDFSGVAKKEFETTPVIGQLAKLADVAFVDRSNTADAIAALQPLTEMMQTKGLSVMAAPEGTRVVGERVGPFKKGPFRMAMAAGVPVVPIVFRNADTVGTRNSSAMRPGKVDVAVLPPISVEDWTLDDLAERIAEVRQRYIDTFDNWPS